MKVLCQIIVVYPFTLIVSLPNQLLGHIPITHVSSQLTSLLEAAEEGVTSDQEDSEDGEAKEGAPPDLAELFRPGQYVRGVVSAVKPTGTTEGRALRYSRDEAEKASRRIELSLIPEQVNVGLVKADLRKGLVSHESFNYYMSMKLTEWVQALSAAVKSVEDHGYILDLGLADVAGFLHYKSKSENESRRRVGSLVDVVVEKLAEDGRTCIFTADKDTHKKSLVCIP